MANVNDIHEHMPVYASCGDRIGTVDGVRGEWLCLARDPYAGDEPHCVPLDWVDSVGRNVQLNKACDEVLKKWQSLAAAGW